MKTRLLSTAVLASAIGFFGLSSAHAAVMLSSDDTVDFPTTDYNPVPTSISPSNGVFMIESPGVNSPGFALSPWAADAAAPSNNFSVIDAGGGVSTSVTYLYNTPITSWQILWGSADAYNTVTFFDGGTKLTSFTGSIFGDCCQSGVPTHDFATFVATDGDVITSVVLTDDGTAAFEYSNVGATPIPGALPLFVGGLGLLGLVSLRRKQKGSPVAFAAA